LLGGEVSGVRLGDGFLDLLDAPLVIGQVFVDGDLDQVTAIAVVGLCQLIEQGDFVRLKAHRDVGLFHDVLPFAELSILIIHDPERLRKLLHCTALSDRQRPLSIAIRAASQCLT
jgi:hypothetical protein